MLRQKLLVGLLIASAAAAALTNVGTALAGGGDERSGIMLGSSPAHQETLGFPIVQPTTLQQTIVQPIIVLRSDPIERRTNFLLK